MVPRGSIEVHNPASEHYQVFLSSQQDLVIYLDKDRYQNPCVDAGGVFIRVCSQWDDDKRHCFLIEPDPDIIELNSKWGTLFFLGEVSIDDIKCRSKLLIYLDPKSGSANRIVTVVEPDFCDIRVKPYQVLELVTNCAPMSHWEWASRMQIDIDLIEETRICIPISMLQNPSDLVRLGEKTLTPCPRTYQTTNKWLEQNHYWFRFNASVLDLLKDGVRAETIHAGTLSLFCDNDDPSQKDLPPYPTHSLFVYLDHKPKYWKKTLATFDKYPIKVTASVGGDEDFPRLDFDTFEFHRNQWYNPPRKHEITPKQIVLKLLPSGNLEDGCNLAPLFGKVK